MIGEIAAESTLVDAAQPIIVALTSIDPEKAQGRYRIGVWVRSFANRKAVEEEIVGRLWYAFQREDLSWPVSSNFASGFEGRLPSLKAQDWAGRVRAAVEAVKPNLTPRVVGHLTAETAVEAGALMLFADGERIIIPERLETSRYLLLDGGLREVELTFTLPSTRSRGQKNLSARRIELKALSRRLAREIGPYAEFAVHRAALSEADMRAIETTVADEIDDEDGRGAFSLQKTLEPGEIYGPGFLFDARRAATGRLEADPPLRAEGPVAIVAIPARLFDR